MLKRLAALSKKSWHIWQSRTSKGDCKCLQGRKISNLCPTIEGKRGIEESRTAKREDQYQGGSKLRMSIDKLQNLWENSTYAKGSSILWSIRGWHKE